MRKDNLKKSIYLLSLSLTLSYHSFSQPDVVAYAGGAGSERFLSVMRLSNGNYLASGVSQSLNWVPASVPRVLLSHDSIKNDLTTAPRIGFLLHLSSDLQTILQVLYFGNGTVENIRHIKTNTIPGAPTGDIFISGKLQYTETPTRTGGYFIAKLDNNFVAGIPNGLEWARSIWATGIHKEDQPWDVGGDGRIVYVRGEAFGDDDCVIQRLRSDGLFNEVVENWTSHVGLHVTDGSAFIGEWTNAYSNNDYIPLESYVALKLGKCALRSWKSSEYNATVLDENGNTKQGSWPLDYFFTDSCNVAFPGSTQAMPGYTGYRHAVHATPYVGGIAVDKQSGDMYIGVSYRSQRTLGQEDYEPFVIAYTFSGQKKWWARLYRETPAQSAPEQFVTGLAIDYSASGGQKAVIVLGRQQGTAADAFWNGNAINGNPLHPNGTNTFQSQFTGNLSNATSSWLGKYRSLDGKLLHSTYINGFFGTGALAGVGTVTEAPDWPNHNAGTPNLTECLAETDIRTDAQGRIYVLLKGRGFTTTRNGYQQQEPPPLAANIRDTRADYAVVYAQDMRSLIYSSALTGEWNRTEPNPGVGSTGGNNTALIGIFPDPSGLIVVGYHKDADVNGIPDGNPIPFTYQLNKQIAGATPIPAIVPAWGKSVLSSNDGETAILAKLTFEKAIVADFSSTPPNGACVNQQVQFFDNSFSPAGIATWSWNFGAGAVPATSGIQNPVVVWTSPGTKSITLTITDSASQTTNITKQFVVSVVSANFPVPTGATSPAPATLSFTGPATPGLGYLWQVTDPVTGQVSIYTSQDFSHQFLTGGNPGTSYEVKLIVTNGSCVDSFSRNVIISGGPGPINPEFTVNGQSTQPVVVCIGEKVTFQHLNVANVVSWNWFFANNSLPSSATTQGPHEVIFRTPGVYQTILTISNGSVNTFYVFNVIVSDTLSSDFTFTGNTNLVPTTLTFTASATGGTNYEWNWGNPFDTANNTATGLTTFKQYTIFGEYIIALTVTNSDGCKSTTVKSIPIGTLLIGNDADFYFSPPGGVCVNNRVTINQVATSGFVAGQTPTFKWDFGTDAVPPTYDGYTPDSVYWTSPGPKIVTLYKSASNRIRSLVYNVYEYPSAEFFIDPASSNCNAPLPHQVSFNAIEIPGAAYFWDFDRVANPGVTTSTSSRPTNISFATARKYAVYLRVNSKGCNSLNVRNIEISPSGCEIPSISAGISIQPARANCASNDLIVQSSSVGTITSYTWSGVSITGPGPAIISGLTSGTVITLTVSGPAGTDTISVTVP